MRKGIEPYELLNASAGFQSGNELHPAIVLRFPFHLDENEALESLREGKTADQDYHGGDIPDEISALISLELGVRLRPGGQTRVYHGWKDTVGTPTLGHRRYDPVLPPITSARILPWCIIPQNIGTIRLLPSVLSTEPEWTSPLMKAARMFQDGLWIGEAEPNLCWLLMVSAIETIANKWRADTGSALERFKESKEDVYDLLEETCDEGTTEKVADLLSDQLGATKKFLAFLLEYTPEQPAERPPESEQHQWDNDSLKQSFGKIYHQRSRALHGGVPFPDPMCHQPGRAHDWNAPGEVPGGTATHIHGGTWVAEDYPMYLHLFVYIVRRSILNWWFEPTGSSQE